MSNLFKKYETDSKRENDGVEIPIDDNVFICRRAGGGNRRYRAAIGTAMNDPALAKRLNDTDPSISLEAEDEVTIKAFADAVVVGWRNVLGRDDKPWEFSKDNFIDLMLSCPDVWMQLRVAARDVENFRIQQVTADGEALGKS
jgi:hypothetical protein